jgi:hypothetical protein
MAITTITMWYLLAQAAFALGMLRGTFPQQEDDEQNVVVLADWKREHSR